MPTTLPVAADDLNALDRHLALGGVDAIDLRDLLDHRLRHCQGDRADLEAGLYLVRRAHHDFRRRVFEDRVERLGKGVGEDEGPRHEGNAEHDGDRTERETQFVRGETLHTGAEHRQAPATRHLEGLHPVEDSFGIRVGHLVDYLTVGEEHHPVGVGRRGWVMGHHDNGLVELPYRAT